MKKFLLMNPFGIGDVLFTTPVIRAIKNKYPDCEIYYWCNSKVKDLFIHDPKITKIFAVSRGDLKRIASTSKFEAILTVFNLIKDIKKEKFDALIDFSLDYRYGLLALIAGIKHRLGLDYQKRGIFLTQKITIDGYSQQHMAEHYFRLAELLGIKGKPQKLELHVTEEHKIQNNILLSQAGIKEGDLLIGIAPGAGASWGEKAMLKHWPAMKYAKVADKLIEKFNAKILILGDSFEKPITDKVRATMKHKPIDLAGRTTLGEMIGLINSLKLLITNDGGPLHIATALGVKTVSIFGPVDERVYGPFPSSEMHIVIKKDIACRPCYKNFRMSFCEKSKQCIDTIEIQEVFEAAEKQLS